MRWTPVSSQSISGDIATTKEIADLLEVSGKILLRCWLFGFLLLLLWFGMFMLTGDLIYNLHGDMFGLGRHELNVIHYSGMAFVKMVVILFFFFPWLAIRLVVKKNS